MDAASGIGDESERQEHGTSSQRLIVKNFMAGVSVQHDTSPRLALPPLALPWHSPGTESHWRLLQANA